MKTLILSIIVLTIASVPKAQNVNIPDANFKNALIEARVDTSGDGEISYAEAKAVSNLYIVIENISDMTGIEAFVNLDSLNCSHNKITNLDVSNNTSLLLLRCETNKLTSLDVSNNTALTVLWCAANRLNSLDVSNNTALKELWCYGSQLTSLDVSNNVSLIGLYCHANQLTSLDVSNNTALESLNCMVNQLTSLDFSNNTALTKLWGDDNQLTSLDVSNNAALTELHCSVNQLTSLDVSNNVSLIELYCSDNQLTSLDISNNTALTTLFCRDNQLTSLNVSNNTALETLILGNLPSLHEVCVWEDFSPDSIRVDTTNSPNVYFTADCSITGLNAYKENSTIYIYPNPTVDIINIEIENINNATIEIYNVSGRLVFSKELDSKIEKIDVSGLSEGMYFIKVRQEKNIRIEKLIVY